MCLQINFCFTLCFLGVSDTVVTQTFKFKSILLYGATSFLGSHIARTLHQSGFHIELIEDIENIPLEPMAWYRVQKLQELNLKVHYVQMSTIDHDFFNQHQIDAVVFIPALLFDGFSNPNKLFELEKASKLLKEFVNLLEISRRRNSKAVLLSLSESSSRSIQKSWLRTFELTLSAYQNLGVQTDLITMNGVYGPWQGVGEDVYPSPAKSCIYIEEIKKAVLRVFSSRSGNRQTVNVHCIKERSAWNSTISWAVQYTKFLKRRKDVVISTYFTSVKNPSHPFQIRPRNGLFMKNWFNSAARQGLNLVIFYDEFSDNFENRVKTLHPNTEFVRVKSLHGRSTNDYRFYLTYKYILEHPEIRRAILTDMRDIKFLNNPFDQMEVIGDYLYVGLDNPKYVSGFEHKWVGNLMKKCHKEDAKIDAVKLQPFLNAGVSGGTRHVLLTFLNLMTRYFDEAPHRENCDMGIFSIVGHKHFHDHMFTGYPLQSAFTLSMAPSQGLSIKHKNCEKYHVYY